MPTMNISLTGELASFVEREVKTGRYASASELVRESLRLLEHEKEVAAAERAMLKAAVQAGLDDMRAGRFSEYTVEEIAAQVRAEFER